MRSLVAIIVALGLVGTAAATGPRIVGVGEQKDGEHAKAHVGDTLVVSLGANPSTGYSWKIATAQRGMLRFDSSSYVKAAHAPLIAGAPGVAVLIFKVVGRGKTTLKLNYVSAGTPKKVGKTFSVILSLLPRGAP